MRKEHRTAADLLRQRRWELQEHIMAHEQTAASAQRAISRCTIEICDIEETLRKLDEPFAVEAFVWSDDA